MAGIISTGSYFPPNSVANEDLKQFPPNAVAMIAVKTGIKRIRVADADMLTSDLAYRAAVKCLESSGVTAADLDVLIVATSTPDRLIPSTASKVAAMLGVTNLMTFDLNTVCCGSLALLQNGAAFVDSGMAKNVLVVAADAYSKILNPSDFSTYPYFGDGAGAALISADDSKLKIFGGVFKTFGDGYDTITLKAGAAEIPANKFLKSENGIVAHDCYFSMLGRSVFDFATTKPVDAVNELLAKYSIGREDVVEVISHQSNINILKKLAQKLEIDEGKFFSNLQEYGNTVGASVLGALDEYLSKPSCGYIVAVGFGAGLTVGSVLLERRA